MSRIIRLACAITLLFAATASLSAANVAPWTQYQANPAHTGNVPLTIDPSRIQPLWTQTTRQLNLASISTGDAPADAHNVYLTVTTPTTGFHVLALDRTTGTPQWSQPVPSFSGVVSLPIAANGTVYVHSYGTSNTAGGNPSQYPRLLGFNATTGAITVNATHDGQWGSGSRPTVDGPQLFAAGGLYGGLDAYDAASGTHQWFSEVNQQYGWTPAADASRVYVYMGPAGDVPGPRVGTLRAFDRATGAPAFSIPNPGDTFTLYNGTVTLGQQFDAITLTRNSGFTSTSVTSFDLLNHTVRWTAPGHYAGALAVDDGTVFAPNDTHLDLLDEATGQLLSYWATPTTAPLTGNVVVTDNLIFAHTDYITFAIDRATLTTAWSTPAVGDLSLDANTLFITGREAISAFAIPEPSTLSLITCAALPLLCRRRR